MTPNLSTEIRSIMSVCLSVWYGEMRKVSTKIVTKRTENLSCTCLLSCLVLAIYHVRTAETRAGPSQSILLRGYAFSGLLIFIFINLLLPFFINLLLPFFINLLLPPPCFFRSFCFWTFTIDRAEIRGVPSNFKSERSIWKIRIQCCGCTI